MTVATRGSMTLAIDTGTRGGFMDGARASDYHLYEAPCRRRGPCPAAVQVPGAEGER